MLFDTDILIWVKRGHGRAADLIDRAQRRCVSVQTYMELLQCAPNRGAQKRAQSFLRELGFEVLPLTENIGHRATVYIEEYSLGSGLRAGDAVIAACAAENGLPPTSSNAKHYRRIRDLDFRPFRS